MDKLRELIKADPCYEQHIVSIKNLYESYLLGILVPIIYEGFTSMYNKSQKIPTKKNIDCLIIFQKILRDLPNLNVHKIRRETERIKTASRIPDIFDDLIRATVKSNIVLLTYNIDNKRRYLVDSRYHENIIIHDFIHDCYIKAAAAFHKTPELFSQETDVSITNKNKTKCIAIIQEAVKSAILATLPMKEILVEYLCKYEQKEPIYHKQSGINLLADEHDEGCVQSDLNDFNEDPLPQENNEPDQPKVTVVPIEPDLPTNPVNPVIYGNNVQLSIPVESMQACPEINKEKPPTMPRMVDVSPILKTKGTSVALFKQMVDDVGQSGGGRTASGELCHTTNNNKTKANLDEILNP